jgi:hypothetical protein
MTPETTMAPSAKCQPVSPPPNSVTAGLIPVFLLYRYPSYTPIAVFYVNRIKVGFVVFYSILGDAARAWRVTFAVCIT